MKVNFYFRDELRASGASDPSNDFGEITWQGGGADEVAAIADHFHERHHVVGVDLLRLLAEKLHGHWRGVVVVAARSD